MKSFVSIISIVSIIIAFSACTKTNQDPPADGCMLDSLTVILTSNSVVTNIKNEYLYDDKKQWVRTNFYQNNNLTGYEEFTYAADGKISAFRSFTAGGSKKEERLVTYDQQGRVSGFALQAFPPYSNPVNRVDYIYGNNTLIVAGRSNADTVYSIRRFFENGNDVRAEYWTSGLLLLVDSISYGSQLNKHSFSADATIINTGMMISKNLHTRRITHSYFEDKRIMDDAYVFNVDPDGKIRTHSISTNIPSPVQGGSSVGMYHYSCD